MTYVVTSNLKSHMTELQAMLTQENLEAGTAKNFPCKKVISTSAKPETLCGDARFHKTLLCTDCHALYKSTEAGAAPSEDTSDKETLWSRFTSYVSSHPKLAVGAVGMAVLAGTAIIGGTTAMACATVESEAKVRCSDLDTLTFGATKETRFYFEDKNSTKLAEYTGSKYDAQINLNVAGLCSDSDGYLEEIVGFSCSNQIFRLEPQDLVSQSKLNRKLQNTKCDPKINAELFFEGSLAQGKNSPITLNLGKNSEKAEPTVKPSPEINNKPTVKPTPEINNKPNVQPTPEINNKPNVQPNPEIDNKPTVKPNPEINNKPTVKQNPETNAEKNIDVICGERGIKGFQVKPYSHGMLSIFGGNDYSDTKIWTFASKPNTIFNIDVSKHCKNTIGKVFTLDCLYPIQFKIEDLLTGVDFKACSVTKADLMNAEYIDCTLSDHVSLNTCIVR